MKAQTKKQQSNPKLIQTQLNPTLRVKIDTGETLTEQAHKDQTDMNYILRDYTRTGMIKHANENQGWFCH